MAGCGLSFPLWVKGFDQRLCESKSHCPPAPTAPRVSRIHLQSLKMGLVLGPTLPNLAVCGFRCSLRRLLLHSVSRVQVTKIPALEGGEGSCSSIMQGKEGRQGCVCVHTCTCVRVRYLHVGACVYVCTGGEWVWNSSAKSSKPEP